MDTASSFPPAPASDAVSKRPSGAPVLAADMAEPVVAAMTKRGKPEARWHAGRYTAAFKACTIIAIPWACQRWIAL
jgi:hypothetical protein